MSDKALYYVYDSVKAIFYAAVDLMPDDSFYHRAVDSDYIDYIADFVLIRAEEKTGREYGSLNNDYSLKPTLKRDVAKSIIECMKIIIFSRGNDYETLEDYVDTDDFWGFVEFWFNYWVLKVIKTVEEIKTQYTPKTAVNAE